MNAWVDPRDYDGVSEREPFRPVALTDAAQQLLDQAEKCDHKWRYLNSRDVFICTSCHQQQDPDTGEDI